MSKLITGTLFLMLVQCAFCSLYQYARQCRKNTEPCTRLRCSRTSPSGSFPQGLYYGCCAGNVYDRRTQVCVKSGTRTFVLPCNPCKQFRCGTGECVLARWQCNRVTNCRDGSDEAGCKPCSAKQFRCSRYDQCINRNLVCDKIKHCFDGSDEFGCLTPSGGGCGTGSYRCANNKCIRGSWVCDGDNDCGDGSDEVKCLLGRKRDAIAGKYMNLEDEKESAKNKTIDAETDVFAA